MKTVMYRSIYSSLLFLFVFAYHLFAQSTGDNDNTFNPNDIGFGNGNGASYVVLTTAIQGDGKILIGGSFTTYNNIASNYIARLNTNGALDRTFNSGTAANATIYSIAVQSDGKILIGGSFTSYNGTLINRMARLNSDGTLDPSFNIGIGFNSYVNSILLQNDNKIIVGGYFTDYNGVPRNRIIRLNTDGSVDNIFNVGTGFNDYVATIAIQNDNKIILCGDFTNYNGITQNHILRLNVNGALDSTFHIGTGTDKIIRSIAIQPDSKIIIGGDFDTLNGTAINRLTRLNIDGSTDMTFKVGFPINGSVYSTGITSNAKVVIGGNFYYSIGQQIGNIARFNSDGTLDVTFKPIAGGSSGGLLNVSIQNDDNIIIAGFFTSYDGTSRNYITKLKTNGTLDNAFNTSTSANSYIIASAIQPDGKILIGGNFTIYNGVLINRIARLNTDGSIDMTFNPGTGAGVEVRAIAIQPDSKIIVGGWFSYFNGKQTGPIVRLNADGSVDESFGKNLLQNNWINDIAIQKDGKIIIGGNFNNYPLQGIARLTIDGNLDSTFKVGRGLGPGWEANSINIQDDGKIIITGRFPKYNDTLSPGVVRVNIDGHIDKTFKVGNGVGNTIFSSAIQNDGKIIVAGIFSSYDGVMKNGIARLNSDGTIDNAFNVGGGTSGRIYTTKIQSNGKIIIGGDLQNYDGISVNRIARLNIDGSLDGIFNVGNGANANYVGTSLIQNDGKIIIAGDFTSYNGVGRNRIARIFGGDVVGVNEEVQNNLVSIYPNPSNGIFNIKTNFNYKHSISVYNVLGEKVYQTSVNGAKLDFANNAPLYSIDLSSEPNGLHFVLLNTARNSITKKIILQH